MLKDYQMKILLSLHDLEKTVGDLYEIFAKRFPEHNTLWDTLIKEEQEHAEAVQNLYKLTSQGQVLFDEGAFKLAGIQWFIDYLKDICDAANHGKYNEKQAVTISLDIEKSLIEKDIFKHFKVSPEFADLLRTLQQGSQAHISLVEKELAKIERKANI